MFKKTITWLKLGRIATPRIDLAWNQTHMSLPTGYARSDGIIRVYYGGRDYQNRSQIGYVDIDLNNLSAPIYYSQTPVLSFGELGTFDDNGVMPCSIVEDGADLLLYYVGWNPRATVRFSFYSGLAISRDGGDTFERYSRAPILERTDKEPFVNASPFVMRDEKIWRMYYVSGEGWIHPDLPKYNIKYAESLDGRTWVRNGHVCIDFEDSGEHALARPCVIKDGDIYRMWFAKKGADFDLGHNYRPGYAESADGINFIRRDEFVNFDVSKSGWDSEMVAYSYVFEAFGKRYMLYNGNKYGYAGFGMAVEA